jgi:hypothetical protein
MFESTLLKEYKEDQSDLKYIVLQSVLKSSGQTRSYRGCKLEQKNENRQVFHLPLP